MEKKTMPKDDKKQPIDDIAKPGSTVPNASAKPVIVTHKPMIKDPMVNESEPSELENEDGKESKLPSERKSKIIEPIANDKTESTESDPEPESKTDETDEKNDEVEDDESAAVVDAVVSQAGDKNIKTKEAQAEAKRREEINKVIESKKYFVKVKASKGKKSKRAILVVLFLTLFGLIGVGIAADAGVLPVQVPFDFIKQQESKTDNSSNVISPQSSEASQPSESNNDQEIKEVANEIPKNYTMFKDAELGISFGYPKKWGVAKLGDYSYEEAADGSRVVYSKSVTFSENSKAEVVFNAHDKIPSPKDGFFSPSSIYDWCENEDGTITAMTNSARGCAVYDTESFSVYEKKVKEPIPAIFFTSNITSVVSDPTTARVLLARTNGNDVYRMFMLIDSSEEASAEELESIHKTIAKITQ